MAAKKPIKANTKGEVGRTGKRIDAIHHGKDKRVLIPSREEAGMEADNPVVQAKTVADYPLNPVTTRGQDPELYWMQKYGPGDDETRLKVDIRSLYRHEHIEPERLIHRLYKITRSESPQNDFFINETFGNLLGGIDELDKPKHYYKQAQDWKNRLIQGDSLLVMNSLLEREGMTGKVQMIYIDPPYGINYNKNWQMKIGDSALGSTSSDEGLTGEPEVIKAFRDTWELAIHSYLTYLRDRLLAARELLTESGSCFVQISDENVHLVRCVMDEVFGSENFVSQITFRKKLMPLGAKTIESMSDFIVWYARNLESVKYHQLFRKTTPDPRGRWTGVADPDGKLRRLTPDERKDFSRIPKGARIFGTVSQWAPSFSPNNVYPFEFEGKTYEPTRGQCWITSPSKMEKLAAHGRLFVEGDYPRYVVFHDDFPFAKLTNPWDDTAPASDKQFIVQTNTEVVRRCMLMTTDPGDLVVDPTCGSATTGFVAEHWGRRWITIDTSRIAINIAKTRLMTATYPWYTLHDPNGEDVRQGFDYKKVNRISLSTLANDELPAEETIYDNPNEDNNKLRVTGPFTVETLQSFEPTPPDAIESGEAEAEGLQRFTERVYAHLQAAGIRNGIRNEQAVFARINPLAHDALHAEGYYTTPRGEAKAYLHIGPQFGMVSRQSVNEAVKECRLRGDADWLVILGFAFESDIENRSIDTKMGGFMVTKVRMHDDLMQEGLIKKDKKAASFVTIGEPDINAEKQKDGSYIIEIRGLDIYDPIRDEVKPRSAADIAYWMVDDDYDGSSFMVRQVFFCGGDKDEFDKWKRGLSDLVKQMTKKKVEQTLKVEIDDEAFDRLYGFRSNPIAFKKGKRVAVRVVSQFGEESTKVITLN